MSDDRWSIRTQPPSMEARFEFEDFKTLRAFLDDLAEITERYNHHPNISFGRTHVSVIIYAQGDELQDVDYALAKSIDEAYQRYLERS